MVANQRSISSVDENDIDYTDDAIEQIMNKAQDYVYRSMGNRYRRYDMEHTEAGSKDLKRYLQKYGLLEEGHWKAEKILRKAYYIRT